MKLPQVYVNVSSGIAQIINIMISTINESLLVCSSGQATDGKAISEKTHKHVCINAF